MFDIILQQNLSENNKLDKTLTEIYTLKGTLREGSSIIDPVILLGGTDMSKMRNVNYMTIPEFGRSYFIKGIDSVTNSLILVTAHVDVLSSFATQIRTNTAIINRQENKPIWNLYLNDGSLKAYQNPFVVTKAFPNPFTACEVILAIAGG